MVTALVTVRTSEEEAAVRAAGVDVLARYPDAMLVSGDVAGLDATEIPDQRVLTSGNAFTFAHAVEADEAAPLDGSRYFLVRLAGPVAPEWLAELRELGADVHDSLPGFTLLVGTTAAAEVRSRPWVRDVTPYRPAMKVAPTHGIGVGRTLGASELTSLAAEESPRLVSVSVFPGEDVVAVADRVREAGGEVVSTTERTVVALAPADAIVAAAAEQGVQAILPYVMPELHNDRAREIMKVAADNVFAGHRLTGAGQVVGVADSGLDTGDPVTIHPDFRGRVVGITSWPATTDYAPYVHDPKASDDGPADRDSGHGTHVAGSVLGDGSAARTAGAPSVPAGVAPQARLFFQAIGQLLHWKTAEELAAVGLTPIDDPWPPKPFQLAGLPADLNALFAEAYAQGVRIHTNSWGSAVAGAYTTEAFAVDRFMWDNPDMLLLFSAGNSGADEDADGQVDPDSVGSPGTAKNCLTVGASENNRPRGSQPPPGRDRRWDESAKFPQLHAAGHVSDNPDGMAAFSSRGPVDGARLKPDVVAPGTNVLSTLSSTYALDTPPLWGLLPANHRLRKDYCWSGGTSMSTPLVAGAAAVVREHLVRERGHVPSGALLKAFLVNGATPMTGQYPGEVSAGPNSVTGFGRVDVARTIAASAFFDGDVVGSGELRTYKVAVGDKPLSVTLVWTDAPSQTGNGSLVNQLYLRVVRPDGVTVDGDVAPYPTAANNVQRVVIDHPVAGEYEIHVHGVSVLRNARRVPGGDRPRQDFALVLTTG